MKTTLSSGDADWPKQEKMSTGLRGFVLSRRFDAFILAIILINTITISISRPGERNSTEVRQLESFCTIVFIIELGLKLAGLGAVEYFGDSWNRLDFIVVLESIVGFIMVRSSLTPSQCPSCL